MAPSFATPSTNVVNGPAVTPVMANAEAITSSRAGARSTSAKRKNQSQNGLPPRDRSESQKRPRVSANFFQEYAENKKVLDSFGLSAEKQLAMERGLKESEILVKQKTTIQILRNRRFAPKQ